MACETDIMGALSMYALKLASDSPSGYLDWNNNYKEERDKCINTHCSSYPKGFIAADFEISNLDILGSSLGYDKCFGACKANIAPGHMTFAKISTDDRNGKIRAYFGEGEFTDDPVDTPGGIAICHINNLQGLLDYMCQNGFEHHVAMNRTSAGGVLNEALGKYLGWDIYWHK
jgi:L-fucose isomerase-like protein